jgi:hypothetical protein
VAGSRRAGPARPPVSAQETVAPEESSKLTERVLPQRNQEWITALENLREAGRSTLVVRADPRFAGGTCKGQGPGRAHRPRVGTSAWATRTSIASGPSTICRHVTRITR